MESADGLVDEYRNAAGNVRDILADLSPYVTDAYELLGRGGNPAYGPRAALQTLANDLGVEREDVAWRVDYIRAFDAQNIGIDGRVTAFVPANLDAAFRQAGLTEEQAEIAKDLMDDGASFVDAITAAQTDDPESTLTAIKLAELNAEIENWNGTDNDPKLDALLSERRALINELTGKEPWEVDEDLAVLAALNNISYEEALFSVTAANIDALSAKIANWSGSDNDPILDQLIRDRDEQIAILTEGDEELALHYRTSLADGLTASEAAIDLAAHIETQAGPLTESEQRSADIAATAEALGIPEDYAEWLLDALDLPPGEIIVGLGGLDTTREDITELIGLYAADDQFEIFLNAIAATAVTETQLNAIQASEASAVDAYQAWGNGEPIDTVDLAANGLDLETFSAEGTGTWYVIRNELGITIAAWYDDPRPVNATRNMTLAESTAFFRNSGGGRTPEDEIYQGFLDSDDRYENNAAAFVFSITGDEELADEVRYHAWPGITGGGLNPSAITEPHVWFETIGLVPVLGEIADGANAVLYLIEGEYGDAAISGVAFWPFIGNLAPAYRAAQRLDSELISSVQYADGHVIHTIRRADGSLDELVEFTPGQILNGQSELIETAAPQAAEVAARSAGDLKLTTDSFVLETTGLDAHDFKYEVLGNGAQVSRFDVYISGNSLVLVEKRTGVIVETGWQVR